MLLQSKKPTGKFNVVATTAGSNNVGRIYSWAEAFDGGHFVCKLCDNCEHLREHLGTLSLDSTTALKVNVSKMYKKWTKVDACFSVKNTPKPKLMNFYQNMTQFLYQKSFSENKYGQSNVHCSEKIEQGLSSG